jgi:hypothetical protein
VLFGNLGCFRNSRCYVSTLGNANPDPIFAITHNNEGPKSETATALYDAGYAVDVDNALVKLLFFWCHLWSARSAIGPSTALRRCGLLLSHD